MVPAPHPIPSESQSSGFQLNPEGFPGTGGQSLRGPGIRDQPLPEEKGMGKLSQDGSQASEKEVCTSSIPGNLEQLLHGGKARQLWFCR